MQFPKDSRSWRRLRRVHNARQTCRPARGRPRDHLRELSGDRHQGDGRARSARRARVRPSDAPTGRSRTSMRSRRRRSGSNREPTGEPYETRGDRLDSGAREKPPRPTEPRSTPGEDRASHASRYHYPMLERTPWQGRSSSAMVPELTRRLAGSSGAPFWAVSKVSMVPRSARASASRGQRTRATANRKMLSSR